MPRIITRELAEKIAVKLEAKIITSGGAHNTAMVYHNDILIAEFGIRRGSEKDKGHDHIPREIFVGPGFAKLLGQCPKSRQDWLDKIREKGRLPAEDDDEKDPAEAK